MPLKFYIRRALMCAKFRATMRGIITADESGKVQTLSYWTIWALENFQELLKMGLNLKYGLGIRSFL